MSLPAIRPRIDHISELSRGVNLPLPELHADHLAVIAELLTVAFDDLRAHAPSIIASGAESEVTALMEARLNTLIAHDNLMRQLVSNVVRGKESMSFDGSHLEKRPDLSIYLTDRNRNFPLVTEAKILDAPAGKTENLYCDQGIRRFVEGEYAWACKEALMIAYVRDGSTISGKLAPLLSVSITQSPPGYLVEELPIPIGATGKSACSRHGRAFHYTHQTSPNNLPGPIALWHLWLS